MEVEKRIQLARMIEKMEQNPEYSRKLGLYDKSTFTSRKEQRREEKRC